MVLSTLCLASTTSLVSVSDVEPSQLQRNYKNKVELKYVS